MRKLFSLKAKGRRLYQPFHLYYWWIHILINSISVKEDIRYFFFFIHVKEQSKLYKTLYDN